MSDLDPNDSWKGRDNFIVSTALWLISSSWGRHLRHRVNPWFLRFWDLFGSQNCYRLYWSDSPSSASLHNHHRCWLCLTLQVYLLVVFSFCCCILRTIQPRPQPMTHRCGGCDGNRIPGTTKYIANRRHRTKGSCPSEINTIRGLPFAESKKYETQRDNNTRLADWISELLKEQKSNLKQKKLKRCILLQGNYFTILPWFTWGCDQNLSLLSICPSNCNGDVLRKNIVHCPSFEEFESSVNICDWKIKLLF